MNAATGFRDQRGARRRFVAPPRQLDCPRRHYRPSRRHRAGGLFAFRFVDQERSRNLQEWQIRLGIVADSRTAAVNEWVENNFAVLRELQQNASLQLYMTELEMAEGRPQTGDRRSRPGRLPAKPAGRHRRAHRIQGSRSRRRGGRECRASPASPVLAWSTPTASPSSAPSEMPPAHRQGAGRHCPRPSTANRTRHRRLSGGRLEPADHRLRPADLRDPGRRRRQGNWGGGRRPAGPRRRPIPRRWSSPARDGTDRRNLSRCGKKGEHRRNTCRRWPTEPPAAEARSLAADTPESGRRLRPRKARRLRDQTGLHRAKRC